MDPGSSTTTLFHRSMEAVEGAPPYPGLLLLHGRGSNEDDLLMLGPQLDRRLVVVSARAPFTFGPDSYYWYDLEASLAGRPSKDSIEFSLNLLAELLDEVTTKYEVDPLRIYVGGFSMGGAMASAAILTMPERVAGGLILSGYLPIHSSLDFKPDEAAGHPVFQAHGTLDPVLPIDFGRMTRDYLAQTPVNLTYHEYPIGHEVSAEELADAKRWMGKTLEEHQIPS